MKTIPVNVIGYGHWGSRLSKILVNQNFIIKNLVTNKEKIEVDYGAKLDRDDLDLIDPYLPTFITTGPNYHHEIIKRVNNKVFVEKPFYIVGQDIKNYKYPPYVNYQWMNSSKLKIIKECIGNKWDELNIEIISNTKVKRGFSIIEDFMPHIISILFELDEGNFNVLSVYKLTQTIFKIEIKLNRRKIIITIGTGDERSAKFQTKQVSVLSNDPYFILKNGIKIEHQKDPIKESIDRYIDYFYNDQFLPRHFISDDFHQKVLSISKSIIFNLTKKINS